jgi:hypothetical protein
MTAHESRLPMGAAPGIDQWLLVVIGPAWSGRTDALAGSGAGARGIGRCGVRGMARMARMARFARAGHRPGRVWRLMRLGCELPTITSMRCMACGKAGSGRAQKQSCRQGQYDEETTQR